MADFQKALAFVLRNEDPKLSGVITKDEGGRTRFGIAEKYHANLPDDFFTCAKEAALKVATDIYRRDYWRGDDIECQHLANKVFDIAVNSGTIHAIQTLQRALGVYGCPEIATDGKAGPKTLAAANSADCEKVVEIIRALMEQFYRHLAAGQNRSAEELESWLHRNKE